MKYSRLIFFRWFCFVLGIVSIGMAHRFNPNQLFFSILSWVDNLGIWSAIAFVVIYVFATLICIPGSILALGGGALFGLVWGAALVFIGAFLGAISAFSLGRYWLQNWAKLQLSKSRYLRAIDKAIATEGWKFAFLLHLSPLIPFNLLNYTLGATNLTFKNFAIATAIGIFPGVILYTFLGSTVGDLTMTMMEMSDRHSQLQWTFTLLGLLITALLTVYLGRIANQKLKELD